MGLDQVALTCFSSLKNSGICKGNLLTLGRQNILFSGMEIAEMGLAGNDMPPCTAGDFGDEYFKWLGFNSVDSLDRSNYEGATVLGDLCGQMPTEHSGMYDVVFDGGTSEHTIDPVAAFKNVAYLTKVGGYSIWVLPANNQMGHGLWQFSPELFFRLAGDILGYENINVYIFEVCRHRIFNAWKCVDPSTIKQRGEARNAYSTQILCVARRASGEFRSVSSSAQSDYVNAWGRAEKELGAKWDAARSSKYIEFRLIVGALARRLGFGWLASISPGRFNPATYEKINQRQLVQKLTTDLSNE